MCLIHINAQFPMKNILLFALLLCAQVSFAQSERYYSKEQPAYAPEAAEIRNFGENLALLKDAFTAGDMGKIASSESAVLMNLRGEIKWLGQRLQSNDNANQARLQVLQNTLQSFDGHAFNPSRSENSARDFALLDKAQKVMEETLSELQK